MPKKVSSIVFGEDRIILAISFLLNAALWASVLLSFPKDSPAAVLHYSVGTGIDFIGEGRQVLVLPTIGTVLLVGNWLVARFVRRASRQSMWLLVSINPVIQLALGAAYFILWRLNV